MYPLQRKGYIELTYKMYFVEHNLKQKAKSATIHRKWSHQYVGVHYFNNIFVEFEGHIFQQIIDIPMGTNCAPLLDNFSLHSYEAEFMQNYQLNKRIT